MCEIAGLLRPRPRQEHDPFVLEPNPGGNHMRHPVSHHGGDVCEVGAFEQLAYIIGQSRHLPFHSCRGHVTLAWMSHPVGRRRSDELIAGGGRHRAARRSRPICPPLTTSAAARAAGPPEFREQAVGPPPSAFGTRTREHRSLGPTSRYRGRPPQGPHETSAFGSERGLSTIDLLRRCRAARGRHSPFLAPGGQPLPLRRIDAGDTPRCRQRALRPVRMTRNDCWAAVAGPE